LAPSLPARARWGGGCAGRRGLAGFSGPGAPPPGGPPPPVPAGAGGHPAGLDGGAGAGGGGRAGAHRRGGRRAPTRPGRPASPRGLGMSRRKPAAHTGLRSQARAAWPTVTGTGAAASATLALLVLICAFVAVAVPRASLGYRTAVLQRTLAAAPAVQKTVLADGDLSAIGGASLSVAGLEKARVQLAAGLHRDGLLLARPAARWQWSGLATGTTLLSGARAPALRHLAQPQLELIYRSTLASHSVVVAGSLPTTMQRRAHPPPVPRAGTPAPPRPPPRPARAPPPP